VADREDAAVAIGAQADALDGVGAVRRDVKDLLPGQRVFTGRLSCRAAIAARMASALTQSLPPKPPPMNGLISRTFSAEFSGLSRCLLTLVEHLVRGVQDQLVAVPHRKRGMRLHHRVTLQGVV
jgi:hypothetical protein